MNTQIKFTQPFNENIKFEYIILVQLINIIFFILKSAPSTVNSHLSVELGGTATADDQFSE